MSDETKKTVEKPQSSDLNLQSFDLGEIGGGKQLIIDYRIISSGEYYVMTLGDAPKSMCMKIRPK